MAINTEKLELISKDKRLEALKLLLENVKEEYNLDDNDAFRLISGEKQASDSIPLAVFSNDKLSCLEIIVKYLKENRSKTYHDIASQLNRDDRTIWSTYNNSLKKHKTPLVLKKSDVTEEVIPILIFYQRKNSILESLVFYLKDNLNYSFTRISEILLKDYQTIYTTYKRGKSKHE